MRIEKLTWVFSKKMANRLAQGLVTLVVSIMAAASSIYLIYPVYITGPRLEATPSSISLESVFPMSNTIDKSRVADALQYSDEIGATAVIVLQRGQIVAEFGQTDRKSSVHSVRKSMLSAMYGIAIDRGLIDIDLTLKELGINDRDPGLTPSERSAKLRDLLTARSGIYHSSVKDDNGPYPDPGTHAPDEAFIYNNWSFNAAGGIFEQLTGMRLGDAFSEWIAEPIGMEDFRAIDVRYYEGPESVFPAWRFWMSARDMARFGQMMLQGGTWNDNQIVPSDWVNKSLTPYTVMSNGIGYGYLWWTKLGSSFMATGTGGQKIRFSTLNETVIVTKVDTGDGFTRMLWARIGPRLGNRNLFQILTLLGLE